MGAVSTGAGAEVVTDDHLEAKRQQALGQVADAIDRVRVQQGLSQREIERRLGRSVRHRFRTIGGEGDYGDVRLSTLVDIAAACGCTLKIELHRDGNADGSFDSWVLSPEGQTFKAQLQGLHDGLLALLKTQEGASDGE
jgi:transcriptional regulator with XRE-family HTH domain